MAGNEIAGCLPPCLLRVNHPHHNWSSRLTQKPARAPEARKLIVRPGQTRTVSSDHYINVHIINQPASPPWFWCQQLSWYNKDGNKGNGNNWKIKKILKYQKYLQ